ncbi:toxin [Amycolatopsis carbonis]|uniref:Toxin n=1 Tax=Amycolatopsis carbonis TaxID=715471 RepID=A0A9Y2ILV1_9PSEU|nr:toxin [Amycolatopsis sp. 2-15]WIX82492.1 toxin [Amycolatopsis sp. 2-15]
MAEERRDQLRRMREEGARRIAELDLPEGCDLPTLCERLGTIRERPITLVPMPMPASHPCGMWVAAQQEDLIFFDANTTGAHQEHIILHELGHIICCHRGSGLLDDESARSLFPNLDPDIVRDMLMRATYDDAQEQEAEIIAYLLSERMGVVPAPAPAAKVPAEQEKPIDRIERMLL